MRFEELQKLISKGESEVLEFKKTTGQRTEAAKTVCALSNGLGGFEFDGHRRWENEPAPEWVKIQDLDEDEIQLTLENAVQLGRMKKPLHSNSESILRDLGLYDDGRLINAAVVLYGKSKKLFSIYPQLSLKVDRFRGGNRLGGFMDNRDFWGNAFDLLRRGESFLMYHVPISGRVVPGKMIREDYPLYPPFATREIIANCLCHRDYTSPGGAVAIAMHNDYLEIINPGTLHFDLTPEKLKKPHESIPWNPIIANVFYRVGVIEQWGRGTLSVIDWCKKNGNPEPTWTVRDQSVITTFLPSVFFATGMLPDELKVLEQRQE